MKRAKFGSRLGFILVSAGCAIGIGNVWKFPYLCGQFGGAAFILIYLIFLLIMGIPVMICEFAAGRVSQLSVAGAFENLFGFTKKVGNSSVFAGSAVEVMKTPYLGTHGHIAIGTNYIQRAIYHMELQGVEFDMDTAKYDKNGKMVAVYVKGEFGGFAVHLVQK